MQRSAIKYTLPSTKDRCQFLWLFFTTKDVWSTWSLRKVVHKSISPLSRSIPELHTFTEKDLLYLGEIAEGDPYTDAQLFMLRLDEFQRSKDNRVTSDAHKS